MGELSYITGGDSNLVSFRSAARVPITSLKAHFLPKQDLHGYSKPWPGGGGKNLFNYEDSSILYNMWPGNDKLNTQSTTVSAIIPCKPSTTYTMSKSIDSVIFVGCWIKEAPVKDVIVYGRVQNVNGTITVTTGEDAAYLVCWFYNNAQGNETSTIEQIAQTLQIEIGSAATAYEPYSNVCPIEGWNSCEVYQAGKNVIDLSTLTNARRSITYENNELSGTAGGFYWAFEREGSLPLSENLIKKQIAITMTAYTEANSVDADSNGLYIKIYYTDNTIDYICINKNNQKTKETKTGISNAQKTISKIAISYGTGGDNIWHITQLLLEINSENTEYESYCGKIIPITFPAVGKNLLNIYLEQTDLGANMFQTNKYALGIAYSPSKSRLYYFPEYIQNLNIANETISYYADSTSTAFGISYAFSTNPNVDYTISIGNKVNGKINVLFWTITNQGYVEYINQSGDITDSEYTYTTPTNTAIMVIQFLPINGNSNVSFSNIQLEQNSSATTYEKYINTVYGGYIDIAKGQLVATHKKVVVDSGITFAYRDQGTVSRFRTNMSNLGFTNGSGNVDVYFNYLQTDIGIPWSGFVNVSAGSINAKLDIYMPPSYNTVESFTEYLTQHPLEFSVSLLTNERTTYQLSPIQLKTLLNQNNIWSNTNSITEVGYALHDTAPIRAAKHRIAAAEPHIAIASGSLAHFETDMIAPIKSAKIYFNPIQAGSGDASPSNIRAIDGWNNITIEKLGKNIHPVSEPSRVTSSWSVGNLTYNNGIINFSNGTIGAGNRFTFKEDTIVTYSAYLNYIPINAKIGIRVYHCTKNGVTPLQLELTTTQIISITFTCLANEEYWFVIVASQYEEEAPNGNVIISNRQIEINNNYTSYEPYNVVSQSVNFSSTLYGGYIDLITGQLVQTYHKYTFTGSEHAYSITNLNNNSISPFTRAFFPDSHNSGILPACQSKDQNNTQSSCYSHGTYVLDNTGEYFHGFAVANVANTATFAVLFLPCNATESAISTYLSTQYNNGTPVEVCYPLQTPITYQLTPQQLKTLRGINNIWSNTNGNIEIQYYTH